MGLLFNKKNKATESDVSPLSIEVKGSALEHVLDYFIQNESFLLARMQEDKSNEKNKEAMLKRAKEQFTHLGMSKEQIADHVKQFERYIWGYYRLDELIEDKEISDIKCYTDKRIRVKRLGERMDAPENVKFSSKEDYTRLVNMVAVKNQVNISTLNALQTFTDSESNPDFILRCDICTEYINSHKYPVLQIRKFPKYKYSLQELIKLDFLTPEQAEYLSRAVTDAKGMYFTGAGSSGKTTLMNTLIDRIPHNNSGLAIQENPELFSDTHPDLLFQRIRKNSGENRVQYDLGVLAKNGLLIDIDYFIIGEIKGKEAAEFMKCSYTGVKCWATGHGQNEKEGIYKLADYIKQATDYSFEQCLRMLTGLEVIVYLKNWQVAGIAEIKGYDMEKKDLIIETVDLPVPPPRVKRTQEGKNERN